MFGLFSKRKEEKIRLKVEQLLEEGLNKISHRLYNQAMINFNAAIAINKNLVSEILEENFNRYYNMGDWDSALSIGSVILQIKQDNYKLANKIGNCARKIGDYKQANNLYRIALRANKKYKEAFYNLSASMGKVKKYDLDVKHTIDKFINFTDFIFPDYLDSPNYVTDIEETLIQEYESIEDFEDGEKIDDYSPTYDEVVVRFDQKIEKLVELEQTDKNIHKHQVAIFNECIYALINRDSDLAEKRFSELTKIGIKFEYYSMLKALVLARQGKLTPAAEAIIRLLGKDRHNRFLNVNLGLIYKKAGNSLLMTKYSAIGASLLEKSDGLYKISEVFTMAVEHFKNNDLRKSLAMFKIVVSEQDNTEAWSHIGDICFKLKNVPGAVKAYRKIVSISPQSNIGDIKLKEIHDFYFEKGLINIEEKKIRAAADYFKKALNVVEILKTFEKAIELYIKINDLEQVQELQQRYDAIKQKEKDMILEQLRQELKKRAKQFLKNKKFEQAIDCYEKAFEMKTDKDVFMYLAYIYKNMQKKDELEDLMVRWEKMLDDDEKLQQRERDIARAEKAFT
ncbi:MAG: tetratricopeptide repeat protein [Deltaproteobacteria bacterium]|jgi:tetratricopeptide (TPR) repeat protein|nr:tetratricopeptide repeat protein [Deltaproteobacteria bacterium]